MGIRTRLTLFMAIFSLAFQPLSITLLPAQGIGGLCPPQPATSSMLSWLVGKQVVVQAGPQDPIGVQAFVLCQQGKSDEAKKLIASVANPQPDTAAIPDSSATYSSDHSSALGMLALAYGPLETAIQAFGPNAASDTSYGGAVLSLAAAYLLQYGQEAPIFPGFNGGFYNYLKDKRYDGQKLSLGQFDAAVRALYSWFQLSGGKSPLALELLGDVLYRHPDRFIGNYFGALVYMRAATLVPEGPAREVLMEKGLYAMSAPSEAKLRFDRYQYTQLHKALLADIESAALPPREAGAESMDVIAGDVLYLGKSDGGELSPMLHKAAGRATAVALERAKPVMRVDAREVKKTTSFNLYALLLIGTVLGAIVFFWVKLKRASRE